MKIILSADKENNYLRVYTIDKPKGWIIMDTQNNPFFPLKDLFIVDKGTFDTEKLKKYFHYEYGGKPNDMFLPWHYTIDIVNETPFIINNRPFNYQLPIPGYEKYLSIMIIGDSNQDIYNDTYYKTIANMIINPFRFLNGFYLLNQRKDFKFFTGKNFNKDALFKWIL